MRCPHNTQPIVQNRGWKHVKSKQESMGRAALSFFWNYNTVEMTLLASAVLVNLAGVMCESNRFRSEHFNDQRDGVTIFIMMVIIASPVSCTTSLL